MDGLAEVIPQGCAVPLPGGRATGSKDPGMGAFPPGMGMEKEQQHLPLLWGDLPSASSL